MSIVHTFLTLLCVSGISLGQLLFKKAATSIDSQQIVSSMLFNGWLWAAFMLYSSMTILWVWVLRHVSLHAAYPFMGLAFIIVPLFAWLFLKEPLSWQTLAGGFLIIVGVTLASWGQ